MMDTIFKDRRSLALKLRDLIRQMLREKYYRLGDRLPSEENLVHTFGVSRATIREALKLLEEEKLIHVRHGLGRFVAVDPNNYLTEDITRLDSVTEMAGDLGIDIETEVVSFSQEIADEISRARLELDEGSKVYILQRARKTGGETIIFSTDIFPFEITRGEIFPELFTGSLLDVMENQWGEKLAYSRATLSAAVLSPEMARRFHADGAGAWIVLEQVNYDEHDHPILYSQDYHRGDKFRFHVLRRRR